MLATLPEYEDISKHEIYVNGVALGLQAFLAIANALQELRSSDHSYSSYGTYCNIWDHDYKVTY